ncbi:MAG: serine/threonine protein kinase, partial [Planctomycetes bacterium]|nr:serine/threonine protein kinase [Planctomycetota bacterium]
MTTSSKLSETEFSDEDYKKALSQTVSDESFNDVALVQLTQTIGDDDGEAESSDEVKNSLLNTLDDHEFNHKFIDFYPDDENESLDQQAAHIDTDSDDWESAYDAIDDSTANNRLEESCVPGRYKVNAMLGSGKSGQIFAVQDNNLERNIAVKFMHPEKTDDFDSIQDFIQEGKTTAGLNHPGILPIHDMDFTDGALPFFSMRKIIALSLEEIIERSQKELHTRITTFTQRADIIIDVCEAVAYAHNKGVVHGDIKPGNIMHGSFADTMLLDWKTSTSTEDRLAENNKLIGTPIYMSPEQARRECCDQLSDIYCIGSTLLHVLTLRYPIFHKDPAVFWKLKREGEYQVVSANERENIPNALLAIAEKAMHKDRERRYQDVSNIRNDLMAYVSGNEHEMLAQISSPKKYLIPLVICAVLIIGTIAAFAIMQTSLNTISKDWPQSQSFDFNAGSDTTLNAQWSLSSPNKQAAEQWHIKEGALRTRAFGNSNSTASNIFHPTQTTDMKLHWSVLGYRATPDIVVFICGKHMDNAYSLRIDPKDTATLYLYKKGIMVS